MDDATGGRDEPKRPVVGRRRGLGKGLGAILPSADREGEERARRDQLTDLPDRSVLEERFEEAMTRCRDDGASLAVLVVALDGFSDVNESYGHSVGDSLLHDAAARLSAARRSSDTVARFAGDEFVVVCPYVASGDFACQMAARILEDLSRPTPVEGVDHHLSASIGVVVTSPGDATPGGQTLETLVGDASLAMRHAKDEGGASWKLFDPSMREHVAVRSQSRQDLRAALEDDDLVLEYEPIVDLDTGEVIGDSAILGWRQLGSEVDQPAAPLDLVDEAGLAVPVGRWVLDRALADLGVRRSTSSLPEQFRVWVKVAPSLVADPTLVDIVDELTDKHRISASALGFDVREPSAAALASTESTLRAVAERGVLVALDDFGSGQSNLALLQRLPITNLKLAPDLVAALDEDPGAPDSPADERAETLSREAAALVRGLIELGRALELTVVAQGVESDVQVSALRALGCEFAQGSFLADGDGDIGDGTAVEAGCVSGVEDALGAIVDIAPVSTPDVDPETDIQGVATSPGPAPPEAPEDALRDPAEGPPEGMASTESLWAPGTLSS